MKRWILIRIEDILSETKEGAEKQNEINKLFAGQAGDEIDERDEEELLKELNSLVGVENANKIEQQLPEVSNEEIEQQLPEVSKEPILVNDLL